MILGYILICGMGAAQPNAVDGCMVTTRLFPNMEICEEGRQLFLTIPTCEKATTLRTQVALFLERKC